MPAIKKTDIDVASVASSTKPAPAPMVMSTTLVDLTNFKVDFSDIKVDFSNLKVDYQL